MFLKWAREVLVPIVSPFINAILWIIGWVPLLQCLVAYEGKVHKIALKKFAVLLVLTSLPVIVTAFMSPIPQGDGSVLTKLLAKIGDSLTVPELFVYSATFLTPILYMTFERTNDLTQNSIQEFKKVFRGFGLVTVLALLVIVLTAIAFGATKYQVVITDTFLHVLLVEYSPYVYFFGLYCWYLTLLDGANTPNFVKRSRQQENKLANEFSQRLEQRGG